MITWQDSYSTGVEELDKQHKAIFQCANELGKTVAYNAVSGRIINGTMNYLKKYIEAHFGKEETCMHKLPAPSPPITKTLSANLFKAMEEKTKEDETNLATSKNFIIFWKAGWSSTSAK